jgi:hypothetical protein
LVYFGFRSRFIPDKNTIYFFSLFIGTFFVVVDVVVTVEAVNVGVAVALLIVVVAAVDVFEIVVSGLIDSNFEHVWHNHLTSVLLHVWSTAVFFLYLTIINK